MSGADRLPEELLRTFINSPQELSFLFGLFNDAVSSVRVTVSNCGMILTDEVGKTFKESVVAYFIVLYQLLRETAGNHGRAYFRITGARYTELSEYGT
jgi:hypothetical protein